MALSMSRCEELGAPQEPRDDAGARGNATQRVAPQPAQASSAMPSIALYLPPDLESSSMKSLDSFSGRLRFSKFSRLNSAGCVLLKGHHPLWSPLVVPVGAHEGVGSVLCGFQGEAD